MADRDDAGRRDRDDAGRRDRAADRRREDREVDWHDPWGLRTSDEDEPPDEPGLLSRRARLLVGVSAVVLVAATAVSGAAGLLVATSAIAGIAVLVLALRLPGAAPARYRPRPGPPVENAPFTAYRQVAEQLSWAEVSPRHYDVVTRPLLTRLAAARLADRHHVDLWSDPAAARAVVGEEVWPWVDPAHEPSRDSQPPGVSTETLTRIVDRLEQL